MRRPLRARATADGAAAGGGGRLSLARARSWTARLRIPVWRPAPREGASRGWRGDVRLRAAGGARAVAARGCLGAARAGGRLARRGGAAGMERGPHSGDGRMTQKEVLDELKAIAVERLRFDPRRAAEMTLETTLPKGVEGSLGLDSLDFIELSVAIEERFGIMIDETQDLTDEFLSLESLARFVLAKTGQT